MDTNGIRRKMVTLDPIIDTTHWSWAGQAYGSWGFDATRKPDIAGWLGSIWISKTSTVAAEVRFKSTGKYSLAGKTFGALLYIADDATVAKINYVNIVLYDSSRWRAFDFTTLALTSGRWILVRSAVDSYTAQDASFNVNNAVYVDLKLVLTGAGETVAANKVFWSNLHYMG
jgi:hypothetical protein